MKRNETFRRSLLREFVADEGGIGRPQVRTYFSDVLIEANLVLSFDPIPLTTAMIASEMPAAMRPYSMAVAAVSSARNSLMIFIAALRRNAELMRHKF
jgi:hypothetical protein